MTSFNPACITGILLIKIPFLQYPGNIFPPHPLSKNYDGLFRIFIP
ncbi:hypothetical protein ECMP0215612_0361 [Escherichia coli MP021561.2]|nr:hypothetical protein ECMP0215612_0361 [Escherichia coli MP021561.2]